MEEKTKEYVKKAGLLLAKRKMRKLNSDTYTRELMALARNYNDLFLDTDDNVIEIYRDVRTEAGKIIDCGGMQCNE